MSKRRSPFISPPEVEEDKSEMRRQLSIAHREFATKGRLPVKLPPQVVLKEWKANPTLPWDRERAENPMLEEERLSNRE